MALLDDEGLTSVVATNCEQTTGAPSSSATACWCAR